MKNNEQKSADDLFPNKKTVYGPIQSWRFGQSLGIDPIFKTSTCSFNCIYCQLGHIQNITNQRLEYVPTQKIIDDLEENLASHPIIDVITISGSGEPTLALNLAEIITALAERLPSVPITILTNGTTLNDEDVVSALLKLDKVTIKIDAINQETYQRINRPVDSLSFDKTLADILRFRKIYKKNLEIQSMFMPFNVNDAQQLAILLKKIAPDNIQLNTPKRAYPLSWERENRGNHLGIHHHKTAKLNTISKAEAVGIENILKEITGQKIDSIY